MDTALYPRQETNNKAIDIEDYQDDSRYDLASVPYFYTYASIKDNSFKKLTQTNGLTVEQVSILEDLNDLYGYR